MLQELQSMHQPTRLVMVSDVKTEKKASKSSSRSVAFQAKKNALFTDARATVDAIVREGAAYMRVFHFRWCRLADPDPKTI